MATGADEAVEAGIQEPLVAGGAEAAAPSRAAAAASYAYAVLAHLGVWCLMGVLTVFSLRVFGPPVLYFCALVCAVLIVLAYFGATVDWRRAARMGARALDADGDGRLSARDVGVWAQRALDVCLGFGGTALVGYALGVAIGLRMF